MEENVGPNNNDDEHEGKGLKVSKSIDLVKSH
jgi:hypothetical protein